MADDAPLAPLRRFTLLVGGATTLLTALVAFSPLLDWYLGRAIALPPPLWPLVRTGLGIGVLLPLVTALGSHVRGRLVALGATNSVYRGMALNLATHVGLLALGVWLRLPGMWVAAGAFTLAAFAEFGYLSRQAATTR
jgi:hypothetical protein